MLHVNSFISLINRPTRIKKESATLIDNIFTSCYTDLENWFQCLLYTDITDHFPIIHVDFQTQKKNNDLFMVTRNISETNKQAFLHAISSCDWKSIYDENDAQNAFSTFHSVLLKCYNKHFPKQQVKIAYRTHKSWLSQGLRESIRIKNKLFLRYKRINCVKN